MFRILAAVLDLGSNDLVGFKEADAQHQREGHISFDGAQDPCVIFDVAQLLFDALEAILRNQIALVQKQNISIDHLRSPHFCGEHVIVKIFSIDQGDNRIEAGLIAKLAPQKGHGHG